MLIDEVSARNFIHGYTVLMFAIEGIDTEKPEDNPSPIILRGREKLSKDRSLLNTAISQLAPITKQRIDPDVFDAVNTMELSYWVYLKDTRWYSIFIKSDKTSAFAVLGLNDKFRDICGGSGLIFKAGIAPFRNSFISDGLFEDATYLGRNYILEYNEAFEYLKQSGKFFKKPTPPIRLVL